MAGAVVAGVFSLVWLLLKLIFLPVRLVLGLVKFALGAVAGLVGMVAMLALAPVLLVGVGGVLLVGLVVAGLAVLLPLVPFLLLGLLVWSFLKRPGPAVSA
ncbi:MAG: hypothetical protein R2708_09825 [Vicinamibacterales bacterium]